MNGNRIASHWWWPPAAGVAFALAYPPLDLLPLALVGLWPFLAFLDRVAPRDSGVPLMRVFAGGYLFGLALFGALLYWIAGLTSFSTMAVPAYLGSVLVMACNGGFVALAVAWSRRRAVPVAVSFPLAWTAVEWLRSMGDLGFTWAIAADALADYPVFIQSAELGGSYLLSLWLVGLSTAMWRLLRPNPATPRYALGVLVIVLAAANPVYGAVRLAELQERLPEWPRVRAAAIQPNVPQSLKWEDEFVEETHRRLERLTRIAERWDPELVVWPESAVPRFLRFDPATRAFVPRVAREIDAPILTGTNDADTIPGRPGTSPGDFRIYNGAYMVLPDSIVPRRWGKRRLVPVAERVPFIPAVATGFFEMLSSWTGQFAPGREWTTWGLDGHRVGTMICYESTFPNITRQLVRKGGADILLNITNDAWFGPTAAPYQHASHLSLRAVETRTPILRAANTGISGWVDPLGRYRAETGLYRFAVVVADLPVPEGTTPYVRWGDWTAIAALAGWVAASLVAPRRRR